MKEGREDGGESEETVRANEDGRGPFLRRVIWVDLMKWEGEWSGPLRPLVSYHVEGLGMSCL